MLAKSKDREKNDFDPSSYTTFHIDQIQAVDYTLTVIEDLEERGLLSSKLVAVKETDVYRLRRGLCLPSASAVCINWIKGKRVIGDKEGKLKIGDIFKIFAPFHGKKDFLLSKPLLKLSKGWLFSTQEGDVYHQVIVALSESLGIGALSVGGFKSVRDILPLISKGGALAVSLNNKFVPENTLKNQSQLVKKIDGKVHLLIETAEGVSYRKFEDGRHVVAILDKMGEKLVVLDSYRLPQMKLEDAIFTVTIDEIDNYIENDKIGTSRAILFARDKKDLLEWKDIASRVIIPSEIIKYARAQISSLLG